MILPVLFLFFFCLYLVIIAALLMIVYHVCKHVMKAQIITSTSQYQHQGIQSKLM